MTTQKTFKRRVRDRMAKTGESYTTAREQLLPPPTPEQEKTGRRYEEWFALLDAAGAADMTHTQIARWLVAEHGVPGWWSQNITVEYERARGRRVVHQNARGEFYATVSKTLPLPAEALYAAVDARLEEWGLSLRKANPPRSIRTDAEVGRPVITFDAKGDAKATVAVSHERLPDAAAVASAKQLWRERLAGLAG